MDVKTETWKQVKQKAKFVEIHFVFMKTLHAFLKNRNSLYFEGFTITYCLVMFL